MTGYAGWRGSSEDPVLWAAEYRDMGMPSQPQRARIQRIVGQQQSRFGDWSVPFSDAPARGPRGPKRYGRSTSVTHYATTLLPPAPGPQTTPRHATCHRLPRG